MEVETKLPEEYNNTENEDFSYTIVISIIVVIIGLGIIAYAKKTKILRIIITIFL